MTAWIDPDRKIVSRYLGQLRLGSNARSVYTQVLHDFQAVAERRRTIDRKTLEAWLREWSAHWQSTTLLHRARIVDRFLDHLVELNLITSNPIAVLRSELSVKQSRPMWQALASRKPDQALVALRRPKPSCDRRPPRLGGRRRHRHPQLARARQPGHDEPLRPGQSRNEAKGPGARRRTWTRQKAPVLEAGCERARLARLALKTPFWWSLPGVKRPPDLTHCIDVRDPERTGAVAA
jgi:hypothetical protein